VAEPASLWSALLAALALAAPLPVGGARATDEKKLQGTWKIVSVEERGAVRAPADHTVTVKGNAFTLRWKADNGEVVQGNATFRLNEKANPKALDLTYVLFDPQRPVTARAIYQLDGDTLKVCYGGGAAGERPTAFNAKRGQVLMVLQRQKL
jgi:uncharacterized protein (TIGR03067 family)